MPKGDYRPIALSDGLKPFLKATLNRHNNRGFTDLDDMIRQGLNTSNIGLAFGFKSWKPADRLIRQYYDEGFGAMDWRVDYASKHNL